MKKKLYLGIDPGVRGAFAILDIKGNLVDYWLNDKDINVVEDKLSRYTFERVIIEKAQAMGTFKDGRGQGIKSMFTYGVGYGKLLALLDLNRIVYAEVPPVTWQYKVLGRVEKGKSKDKAQSLCKLWHPEETFIPPRCRVIHDGVCDAVAIAHYSKRYGSVHFD